MTSSLGWIDFSSEHRERVRTVLDLLSAPGVVDELGIGVVRDALADRMFPGISTVQTRPKYFTLTALLLDDYLHVEKRKRSPRSLQRYLEEEEISCRIQLVERHGEGRQRLGIIGNSFGTRRDRDVVRNPSSIYWTGLCRFGIVSPRHLSLAEFARCVADESRQLRTLLHEQGNERGDDPDAEDGSGLARVLAPEVGPDYWEDLSIELTREEALFLRHQISARQPDSLVGQILLSPSAMEQIALLPDQTRFEDFATLPFVAELRSEELRRTVAHARDFWRLLKGAHILYNCLLRKAGFGLEEERDRFEADWEEWRDSIARFPEQWDSSFLWSVVHRAGGRPGPTRVFVDSWIEQCRRGAAERSTCERLVIDQEIRVKRSRARLRPGNKEAVDDWAGIRDVNYRAPQVMQLVSDILDGESRQPKKGGRG